MILLGDIQNAIVRDNRIVVAPPLGVTAKRAESVSLANTEAVRLENNAIKEPEP